MERLLKLRISVREMKGGGEIKGAGVVSALRFECRFHWSRQGILS